MMLDIDASVIAEIRAAMIGRVISADGRLSAWNQRQPKREDNSTDRVRAYRERIVTQRNERETRTEQSREERKTHDTSASPPSNPPQKSNSEKSNGKTPPNRGARLNPAWTPSVEETAFADKLGLNPDTIAASFRDYWIARPGPGGIKLDWSATWRNWCRRQSETGRGNSEPKRPATPSDDVIRQQARLKTMTPPDPTVTTEERAEVGKLLGGLVAQLRQT